MKKLVIFLLGVCFASVTQAATVLDKSSANHFINDFYKALKSRDAHKLDLMIADNAKIQLHLVKMHQSFTLSKSDYLQQIKASWHFAKQENFDLSDLNYTSNGATGSLTLKMTESKDILNEKISFNNEMTVSLLVEDDMIKIAALTTNSTF